MLMVSMAAVVAAGLGAVGAGSAFAGTNGQHIEVCQNNTTDFTLVSITGSDQDGNNRSYGFDTLKGTCITTPNNWWKGDLRLTWKRSASEGDNDATSCEVPEQQAEDVFKCTEEPTP